MAAVNPLYLHPYFRRYSPDERIRGRNFLWWDMLEQQITVWIDGLETRKKRLIVKYPFTGNLFVKTRDQIVTDADVFGMANG